MAILFQKEGIAGLKGNEARTQQEPEFWTELKTYKRRKEHKEATPVKPELEPCQADCHCPFLETDLYESATPNSHSPEVQE